MDEKHKIIITVSCVLSSKRIPKKALDKIEGKETILYLLERLKQQSDYRVVLCTSDQKDDNLLEEIARKAQVDIFRGSKKNVVHRLLMAARKHGANHLIRVTADDLLVDLPLMREMIKHHLELDNDYTYMVKLPRGMDSEIMKTEALETILAYSPKLENTEHVSYYLKRPTLFKYSCYIPPTHYQRDYRLTMDYPEDLKLLKVLFSNMPKNFTNWELMDYLDRHPYLNEINSMPKVSCYITNFNYGDFLEGSINSVLYQTLEDWELIIIDDNSDEVKSLAEMLRHSQNDKIRLVRNEENLGLNITANRALGLAKGKYIIRLDADDVFLPRALYSMSYHLDLKPELGIIYPDYYEWTQKEMVIKKGKSTHHPAGAMIRKSCWNEIKYNENYRCQDGFDFYHRFRDRFGIGYLNEPCFVYRKHKGSLSSDVQKIKETREQMIKDTNAGK